MIVKAQVTDMLEGKCFCGKVSFAITPPTKWCGHCHCSMCQRIHGSGVVTWVGCEVDSVEITDTENQLKWYQSSEKAERGSCATCGSQMFFRSANWPGELHITRANIVSELDREPTGHSNYESHANWLVLGDELPRGD